MKLPTSRYSETSRRRYWTTDSGVAAIGIAFVSATLAGAHLAAPDYHSLSAPYGAPTVAEPDTSTRYAALEAVNTLPIRFEENYGQSDPEVRFIARTPGYNLFLTAGEVLFVLGNKGRPGSTDDSAEEEGSRRPDSVLRVRMAGASASATLRGEQRSRTLTNYYIGGDAAQWRTGVVFYGSTSRLEHDFVVHPGADPSRIKLGFTGAEALSVDAFGDLMIETAAGDVRLSKPFVYQKGQSGPETVEGRFMLAASDFDTGALADSPSSGNSERLVGFEIGPYDITRPLIIDPVVNLRCYN